MKDQTGYEKFYSKSDENRKILAREELIFQITDAICAIMEKKGVTKYEIAQKLGLSKRRIDSVLNCNRYTTVSDISDIAYVLGFEVWVTFKERKGNERSKSSS